MANATIPAKTNAVDIFLESFIVTLTTNELAH